MVEFPLRSIYTEYAVQRKAGGFEYREADAVRHPHPFSSAI